MAGGSKGTSGGKYSLSCVGASSLVVLVLTVRKRPILSMPLGGLEKNLLSIACHVCWGCISSGTEM